jgi:hypothetical protein
MEFANMYHDGYVEIQNKIYVLFYLYLAIMHIDI